MSRTLTYPAFAPPINTNTSPADLAKVAPAPFWVVVSRGVESASMLHGTSVTADLDTSPVQALLVESLAEALLAVWPTLSEEVTKSLHKTLAGPLSEQIVCLWPLQVLSPVTQGALWSPYVLALRDWYQPEAVVVTIGSAPAKGSVSLGRGSPLPTAVVNRERLQEAARYAREGVSDVVVEINVEVEVRNKHRHTNSGYYEGVLRRVESTMPDPDKPVAGCAVCAQFWAKRREGAQARHALFQHLCTPGHVALERGLDSTRFDEIVNMRAAGMDISKVVPPRPPRKRNMLAELLEGLEVQRKLAEHPAQSKPVKALQRCLESARAVKETLEDLGKDDLLPRAVEIEAELTTAVQAAIAKGGV